LLLSVCLGKVVPYGNGECIGGRVTARIGAMEVHHDRFGDAVLNRPQSAKEHVHPGFKQDRL
jgi:hypothetical protein